MKSLKQISVVAFLALGTVYSVHAQEQVGTQRRTEEKVSVFRDLKEKIAFPSAGIRSTLQLRKGEKSKIYIAPGFVVEGEITEKLRKHTRLSTLQMISSNYNGALLTLSEITEDDGSVSYTGRIFHPASGDAYVLTKENNQYFFVRTPSRFLLVD